MKGLGPYFKTVVRQKTTLILRLVALDKLLVSFTWLIGGNEHAEAARQVHRYPGS